MILSIGWYLVVNSKLLHVYYCERRAWCTVDRIVGRLQSWCGQQGEKKF